MEWLDPNDGLCSLEMMMRYGPPKNISGIDLLCWRGILDLKTLGGWNGDLLNEDVFRRGNCPPLVIRGDGVMGRYSVCQYFQKPESRATYESRTIKRQAKTIQSYRNASRHAGRERNPTVGG